MASLGSESGLSLAALLKALHRGDATLRETDGRYWLSSTPAGQQSLEVPCDLINGLLRQLLLRCDANGIFRLVVQPTRDRPGVDADENPLNRLYLRRDGKGRSLITPAQFTAGERLRRDFEISQLGARISSSWSGERVDHSSNRTISDNRIAHLADTTLDARKQFHEALDTVGPELAAILYYVCCLAAGLEQAERVLRLPPRSGKAVLSIALTRLARHYHLLERPGPSAKSRDISHWAMADFKPAIPPLP